MMDTTSYIEQHFIDSIPAGVYWKDTDLVYTRCNKVFAENLGFKDVKEVIGKTDHDLFPFIMSDDVLEEDKNILVGKQAIIKKEQEIPTPSGFIWVLHTKTMLTNSQGEIVGIVGNYQNITSLKQAKQQVKESEEKFRFLSENSLDAIWILSPELRFTYLSPAISRIRGYSIEEIMRQEFNECFDEKSFGRINEMLTDFFKKLELGEEVEEEYLVQAEQGHKDGSLIWTESVIRPIFNADGSLNCFHGVTRNIDARKKAELKAKEYNEEIARQNEELRTSMEEVKKINLELARAKEKAEESENLKSAFLANMSHEIRTPMNAILGFSNLLNLNMEEDKFLQYRHMIQSSGEQLLMLINDIIDISKIEAGQLEVNQTYNFVNTILQETVQNHKATNRILLNKPKIDIRLKIPEGTDAVMVYTDGKRLIQILDNLINNAVKFTRHGFVEVGYVVLENPSRHLQFYVKDTGRGIPTNMSEKIFKRFTQASPEDFKEGTGLGLSIIKGLLELLGGSIWVESEQGVGSIFYFTLPL